MNNLEENINTILEEIRRTKIKRKKFTKFKVYQKEFKEEEETPTFEMIGMLKDQAGYNKLKELGYNVSYTETNQQFNVNTLQTKKLKTICMHVSW